FGNVGGVAASELHDRGARVLAVSDVSGGVHDERGLDVPALQVYVAENGSLAGYDRCERITNEELLELRCDVLVLAAREDHLTNAGGVTVSYFEWVQDLGRLFWDRDEIRLKLADMMSDALDRVYFVSEDKGITLRQAAMVAAIREVAAALEARGIFP